MIFYLEAADFIWENVFRLQYDLTWKPITRHESLQAKDFHTHSPTKIVALRHKEVVIEHGGEQWVTLPDWSNDRPSDKILYYKCFVRRTYFPKLPSKAQLISTIHHGNDQQSNCLVLNVYGFFELRSALAVDDIDPTIVVSFESFVAGNDYVGESAAQDEQHIGSHYHFALEYWLRHLETGKTNFQCIDEDHREPEAEVLRKLREMEREHERLVDDCLENGSDFEFNSFVAFIPENPVNFKVI